MSRYIYVNGQYQPYKQAVVSFEDRGFQFGDGLYNVLAYIEGQFIDFEWHFEALKTYAEKLLIDLPLSKEALYLNLKELVRRNHLKSAHIYIQLTRGRATRVHWFPKDSNPTLVMVATPTRFSLNEEKLDQVKALTSRDIRWGKPDIKTTSLMANVLLRQHAVMHGAFDTWLLDHNGNVTEGASSNTYIVTPKGHIVTRGDDGTIIPGVTRKRLIELARTAGFFVEERPITSGDLADASEAFLTGATSLMKAVIEIDGRAVGNGEPGPLTKALARLYFDFIKQPS